MHAPQPISRNNALPILLAVMFVNLVGFGVIVPLLPFYAESFHAAAWQIALVFSAYSMGAFFGEPFWGRLSDRIGRKPVLMMTVFGNCVCYCALAFAPSVGVAFAVRLLGGIASGNNAVVQCYITDVSPGEERGNRLALVSAASNMGFIIGPALGGWLADPAAGTPGFRMPLFFAAGLSLLCVLGLALLVRESRHHSPASQSGGGSLTVLREALSHSVIARLLAVTLLSGAAFSGVESMFGLWTQARFHWGPHEVGSAFAITGLVAAFCQVTLTGRLSRRYGYARVLASGMALTAICMLLQPLSHAGAVIALLALAAFGQAIVWPNVTALISRNADAAHYGQYLGINNACASLSRLAGPFVLGLSFSILSVNAPFWIAAVLVVPAIGLALSASRRHTRLAAN